MQLVAASKMRVFQKKAISSRTYAWDLLSVLKTNIKETSHSALTQKREEGKVLFLLYTSDKGLCGALNTRILKALTTSNLWNSTAPEDRLLITIGKKSFDFASYRNIPVEKSFKSLNEKLTLLEGAEILDAVIGYFIRGEVKEVHMVAPHYKNSLVYYPVVKTYLPFSKDMINQHVRALEHAEGIMMKDELEEEDVPNNDAPHVFEPTKERFIEVLIEQIVTSIFMQSFFELKAAEYSSRMVAMQNATEAAGDIIDRLTLRFNKARQATITQEIAEIVGGSMA
jgi:F-type H+-transporting ATPase subunit gamma